MRWNRAGRPIIVGRKLLQNTSEELQMTLRDFWRNRLIAKRKGQRSLCPTAVRCRACRDIVNGCGMATFVAQSVFVGNPGTTELPPYCLGHIGYSVVPWKRRRGYATRALALMLSEAEKEGLPYVEIVTDADNIASQKVIEANGGKLVNQDLDSEARGGTGSRRYRICFEQVTA